MGQTRSQQQVDAHVQLRALYASLIQNEEHFHEFKHLLQLYNVRPEQTENEPPDAAALRASLNGKVRNWLGIPFEGVSAMQMLQWRAIVVEERFNVSVSPWKESNSY